MIPLEISGTCYIGGKSPHRGLNTWVYDIGWCTTPCLYGYILHCLTAPTLIGVSQCRWIRVAVRKWSGCGGRWGERGVGLVERRVVGKDIVAAKRGLPVGCLTDGACVYVTLSRPRMLGGPSKFSYKIGPIF